MTMMHMNRPIHGMQLSTCAGLSAVLTRMLCWPIVASTANVRWLGSDAVTAPDLAREFLLEVNQRVC